MHKLIAKGCVLN